MLFCCFVLILFLLCLIALFVFGMCFCGAFGWLDLVGVWFDFPLVIVV